MDFGNGRFDVKFIAVLGGLVWEEGMGCKFVALIFWGFVGVGGLFMATMCDENSQLGMRKAFCN